jgi:hypothetical protein
MYSVPPRRYFSRVGVFDSAIRQAMKCVRSRFRHVLFSMNNRNSPRLALALGGGPTAVLGSAMRRQHC